MRNTILIILLCIWLWLFLYWFNKEPQLATLKYHYEQYKEYEPSLTERRGTEFEYQNHEVDEIIRRNDTNWLEIAYKKYEFKEQGLEVVDVFQGTCLSADSNYFGKEIKIYDDKYCFIIKK